ncbi:hypothetical protein C8235_06650 [Paracidovorax avenae]|nr:hypothetical protein C8235_06650 [Paracidovorax avenae]
MSARARSRHALAAVLRLFMEAGGRRMLLGTVLSCSTVMAGMALLGLSGWFITATALAGLASGAALAFNVFMPSAGIRLLALGRTAGRYAERIVTHDATLAVLAALRERLLRGWARPQAAQALLRRPARLLFRLTQDIDALESIYLRVLVPAAAVLAALLLEPTAGLVAFLLAMWLLHEAATWIELRMVAPARTITPLEQMVHSFMEILPLAGILLLCQPALEAWLAVPGEGARGTALDWRWRMRSELPPWPVLGGFAMAVAVCNGLLLAEESWRCWRGARAGSRALGLRG